jgi:segregation and condensation protein A
MSLTVDGPVRADFEVHLDVYAGPFDVLLGLISKHQLDVTEVALAKVTDEFVAYVRAGGFDLEQATSFLVVAATLLDLKAARLLPGADEQDEDDLALLEARDLLFARLLQYRAFKQVATWLASAIATEATWVGREVPLAEEFASLLPRVVLGTDAAGVAALAAAALTPRAPDMVDITHVHAPRVSVQDAVAAISERLLAVGTSSFRALCRDCNEMIEVVARFLALLELFRDGRVRFEQVEPLGDLSVTWTEDGQIGQEPDSEPVTGALSTSAGLDVTAPGDR